MPSTRSQPSPGIGRSLSMITSAAVRAATGRRGLAAAITDAEGRLSSRVHASGDARARDLGWEITRTPGRSGLTGRTYHDPRFATRTAPAGRTVTTQERRAA